MYYFLNTRKLNKTFLLPEVLQFNDTFTLTDLLHQSKFGLSTVCKRRIYFAAVYFLKQCHKEDPNINECLKQSANFLVANMKRGIPELGITESEPIVIDELGIALGNGPDGYRASFRNIKAFGVSNVTITGVR